MYLAKYLAACGVCSRRKAAELVKSGKVRVNGETVMDPAYLVQKLDKVFYDGKYIIQQKQIYIIMNKPKGYITTSSDPQGRPTVISLLGRKLQKVGLHAIGRLDIDTTGVLLFTNDGDLTQKLAHPKFNVSKTYAASLDKVFKSKDFYALSRGVRMKDGFIKPDNIRYASKNKKKVIVEIHSGKKRIVRRMFKHLQYYVKNLDRFNYSGLTTKGISKGVWRFLKKEEIYKLKTL